MDDFMEKLNEILHSPEGMQQLQQAASMLGLEPSDEKSCPDELAAPDLSGIDLSALSGLFAGLGETEKEEKKPEPAGDFPSFDLGTIRTLQKAMQTVGREDKNTLLLKALKPHLHGERVKRVDEAVRILQLIRLLPLLRETGLFQELF